MKNWPAAIFCDNRGAAGAVVRGSCVAEVGRDLSSASRAFAALRGLSMWVEHAPSGLNCADPPPLVCPVVGKNAPESSVNLGAMVYLQRAGVARVINDGPVGFHPSVGGF